MKHAFVFLITILLGSQTFAQQQQPEVVVVTTGYIQQGKYDVALSYLDSIIKRNPKNVDALMMRGNVILNRDLINEVAPEVYTDNDESIFSGTFSLTPEQKKIVSPKTEAEVEALWQKCLQIDSNRLDIRKGLAMLYAMSINLPKLKAAILSIKQHEADNGEQAFNLNEYARKVKERAHFDEAMEVYAYIAKLFPSVAGVRSDIASEYYYEGRINQALDWLDSTFNFKTVDETSFLNGAYIYSELGYFDNAQDVFNTYSRVYDRKMDKFYYGMRQFADSSDNYYNTLKYFVDVVDSNAYYGECQFAKHLLQFRDSFTLADYNNTVNMNAPEAYKALVHTRAVRQFANCEPYIRYGIQQTRIRNYSAATQLLEEGEQCAMQLDIDKSEYWRMCYGYALYRAGENEKAVEAFKLLRASKDSFKVSAAIYFSGLALAKLNIMHEARACFQSLIDSRTENKYKVLAKYRLDRLK